MLRRLALKKETLAELAPDDLAVVRGGAVSINTCLDCLTATTAGLLPTDGCPTLVLTLPPLPPSPTKLCP